MISSDISKNFERQISSGGAFSREELVRGALIHLTEVAALVLREEATFFFAAFFLIAFFVDEDFFFAGLPDRDTVDRSIVV